MESSSNKCCFIDAGGNKNYICVDDIDSTKKFMETASSTLNWGDLANEIVLDVGCGIGLNSTIFLVDTFPKIRKVIAIDQAADLIDMARAQNMSDKISFYLADIADASTLSPWKGVISKIVCIDCLVWLRDQKVAFVNMFDLLNPGGTAAIMTGVSSPFRETFEYLLHNSNWKYTKLGTEGLFPRFPTRKPQLEDYFTILKETGFEIVHWEQFRRAFDYPSMLEFIKKGNDFISPLLIDLPKHQHMDFRNDFFDAFSTVHGIKSDGRCCVKITTVNLFIRKP